MLVNWILTFSKTTIVCIQWWNLSSELSHFPNPSRMIFRLSQGGITLPETSSSPLKIDGWKMNFPFGMTYFQVQC